MALPPETLKQAIALARSGEREQARALFQAILKDDPNNVTAWLWLGETSSSLEDQLFALSKASALLPADSNGQLSLQNHLNELRGIPSFIPPASDPSFTEEPARPVDEALEEKKQARGNLLREAERHSLLGSQTTAISILNGLVESDPRDEQAWLMLSELEVDPEKKCRSLEKALAINPGNQETAHRLAGLRATMENPLQRGQYLEENGEFEQAIELYRSVIVHSKLSTERVEANRRIGAIQIRQEAHKVRPVNPTINLLRVAVGPVFLFAVMVFMQSGLNPLHTPLLTLPGLVCVLTGSLLVSVTEMRPMHPLYIRYIGAPGTGDEPHTRKELRLLGWTLMALPFMAFFVEAGFRLGALQASMITPP